MRDLSGKEARVIRVEPPDVERFTGLGAVTRLRLPTGDGRVASAVKGVDLWEQFFNQQSGLRHHIVFTGRDGTQDEFVCACGVKFVYEVH